ncbi:hypothetical protein EG831_12630, partial [bacterium]|nr:hypothetical protein [bacterium]
MKASDQAGGDAGGLNGWATALARYPGRLAAALGVLVLATFWPATGFDFLNFDDPDYVTKNPQVQAGLTAEGIHWAFTRGHSGNWHPVTWISHMLDRELFGPGPAGPHFVNIALHGFNAALLFLALRRFTGATWRCFLVAALFAVHPLRVESVAWIAERKDVLSACFGLGAIWAYAGVARQAERGLRRLWLALLLFALSLMSKPMLV